MQKKTHLPQRVIVSDRMNYLAEPWVIPGAWDWIEKGWGYALFPPVYEQTVITD